MRKLTAFNFLTLNGFYKGPHNDIGWHKHGEEEGEYSARSLEPGNILLFGRATYEMMEGFWPTPQAYAYDPVVAAGMNNAEKIVFSSTMKTASWSNTRVIGAGIVEETRKMKQTPGRNMTILGSGSIITQFAEAGLIDSYEIMIDPVVLGEGTPLFKGMKAPLDLRLTGSRVFKSGTILLCYEPL